jgi:tRNA (cmo5U34)-methyltransferase
MLTRAEERVRAGGAAAVQTRQADFRLLDYAPQTFDVILAGAVLHHLRDDEDWRSAFARFHSWLKPGGRIYVADLAYFDVPDIQEVMSDRYAKFLEALGGAAYRDEVFAYIDKEDTPRSLPFQLELLRNCGFSAYDVLHRNSIFACYVGLRSQIQYRPKQ